MRKIEPNTISIKTICRAKANRYEVECWYKKGESGKFVRRDKKILVFNDFWDLVTWMEVVKLGHISGGRDW